KSNRSAIGARVGITASGRTQIGEVQSGSGYFSQNDFALYFGLGAASAVDSVKIRWPSGAIQEWKDIPADASVVLTEGAAQPLRRRFRKPQ
ncbi:MAG: ASPIC/UnbV domain-containing protein, partial [Bryobacteraceae bacterium]